MRPGDPESLRRHPTSLPVSRRRWLVTVPIAIVLVMVTWVLAFGLTRDPDAYRNPMVGHRAPSFTLPSLTDSKTVRLSQFRGQVVVVNFWASWCSDCWAEHEALEQAWRRYRDQGVVFVGINYQDVDSEARAFLRALGASWPQARDAGYRTSIAYGVRGVPETFFIARDGTIAAVRPGRSSYSFLADQISRLL
jgi:cytochrome c biogenesis protein CcmG/thiol:disulfide interchange protein DsbE